MRLAISAATTVAKGFRETLYPFLLVILPFVIVLMPYTYAKWMPENATTHLGGLYAINILLILAGSLNIVGLTALRRSFSIMAEARVLVTTGPYRWVRHPLYFSILVLIWFCPDLTLDRLLLNTRRTHATFCPTDQSGCN